MSLLLLLRPGTGVAAVCLNADGSLTYRATTNSADMKLYLNSGELFARLTAIAGDRLVSQSSGELVAT